MVSVKNFTQTTPQVPGMPVLVLALFLYSVNRFFSFRRAPDRQVLYKKVTGTLEGSFSWLEILCAANFVWQ